MRTDWILVLCVCGIVCLPACSGGDDEGGETVDHVPMTEGPDDSPQATGPENDVDEGAGNGSEDGAGSSPGGGGGDGSITLADLQDWQRHDGPVLRDPEPGGGYEVAGDPHVFRSTDGALRMVYSGPHPDNDYATIKLAKADDHDAWSVDRVLLSGSNAGGLDLNKETAFYRLADSGKHQIYYIGYEDETTYASQIFVAEAESLEGPYLLPAAPIITTGLIDGLDVKTITSPSIVEHAGRLYMAYCAWNGFPEPTDVRIHGAISDDDGQSWDMVGEVSVPVGMEGAMCKGPDGRFYAVAEADGGLTLGRSDEPYGDYDMLPEPILRPAGAPWEVDELIAPQLFFDGGETLLYYAGAEHAKGWWVMLARLMVSGDN